MFGICLLQSINDWDFAEKKAASSKPASCVFVLNIPIPNRTSKIDLPFCFYFHEIKFNKIPILQDNKRALRKMTAI